MNKKAVFLDRDGTLIIDRGYIYRPDQVELIPGVPEALFILQKRGYLLIVISNQSGIGRGFFGMDDLDAVNRRLFRQLIMRGILITAFYCCPHSPDMDCYCRKPRPGLLLRAMDDYRVEAGRSYFAGDKWTDVQAAAAAGVQPVFLSSELLYSGPVITADSLRSWTGLIEQEIQK